MQLNEGEWKVELKTDRLYTIILKIYYTLYTIKLKIFKQRFYCTVLPIFQSLFKVSLFFSSWPLSLC